MCRNSQVLGVLLVVTLGFLSACSSATTASVPVRTYQMGERVPLAPLTYAVFEKQWLPELGTGTDARLPQHRFLLVRLSATSGAGTETYVPNLVLEDDAGNTCPEINNGDGVPNWIGYLRPIKPTDTLQGNAIFDCVPKHYRLKLTNEDEKVAYVDIPLAFDSDSPAVPMPASKDEKTTKTLAHPK